MNELNKERMGKVIRQMRETRGLTQEEFAEASGIHPKHVGRIESGVQGITLDYLCKIADGLNISIQDLVSAIFEASEERETNKKILLKIQSQLKAQPLENLKSWQRLIAQLSVPQKEQKSLFLLDVRKSKKRITSFALKKIS